MSTATMPRRALFPPKNAPECDAVMTPLSLARRCVQVLAPTGRVLEPCAGPLHRPRGTDGQLRRGGFYHALWEARDAWNPLDEAQNGIHTVEYCELADGLDFLMHTEPAQWVCSNPPWSKLTSFLSHACSLAPNVAFLCLIPAVFFTARLNAAREHGHAIRAIWRCDYPPEWTRSKKQGGAGVKCGMALGLVWWQQGYSGPIEQGELPELQVREEAP